jgi:YVTN family beta-propeller protein
MKSDVAHFGAAFYGARAYVTNLLGDDVTIIDTDTNREISRIPVGDMPNGISIWSGGSKIIN